MILRVAAFLAVLLTTSLDGEEPKKKIIPFDTKSKATILAIDHSPLRVKIRFTNGNAHDVQVVPYVQILKREDGDDWEDLFGSLKDHYTDEDIIARPPASPIVKTNETVEVELASKIDFKEWSDGDVLRVIFVHMRREEDVPGLDRHERTRGVVTAPYKANKSE